MWINTETLQVYPTIQAVRRAVKRFSFAGPATLWPAQLANYSWEYGDGQVGRIMKVREVPRPQINHRTHDVSELPPAFDGTEWVQAWAVTAAADEPVRRESIRARKLAAVNEKLEAALLKRTLQWARNQFPAVVNRAQQKIDAINAAEDPESVDIEDIQ